MTVAQASLVARRKNELRGSHKMRFEAQAWHWGVLARDDPHAGAESARLGVQLRDQCFNQRDRVFCLNYRELDWAVAEARINENL